MFATARRNTTLFATAIPKLLIAMLTMAVMLAAHAPADASPKFRKWVKGFEGQAAKQGIRRSTFRTAFKGVTAPDPKVLELARWQPEFRQKLWMYFETRVNERGVARGKLERANWAPWLDRMEAKYGVDRDILMGIWSMETGFGEALKKGSATRNVVRSLATLAYADRKRRKFARRQLIAVMKILQEGRMTPDQLRGSWAGAMGHTQFIPTSYRAYAQDMDGDGRKDIWTSVPDALATAAQLLKKNGWRTGETWGYEVTNTKRAARYKNKTRTVSQWAKLGVRRVAGRKFPSGSQRAVLKYPAGANGPAFLMTKNFYVLKRYNNADKYALAVGHLADRIAGGGNFIKPVPRPFPRLDTAQLKELQAELQRSGLYEGNIDGRMTGSTRRAIKAAQKRFNQTPTGFVPPSFASRLRQ